MGSAGVGPALQELGIPSAGLPTLRDGIGHWRALQAQSTVSARGGAGQVAASGRVCILDGSFCPVEGALTSLVAGWPVKKADVTVHVDGQTRQAEAWMVDSLPGGL